MDVSSDKIDKVYPSAAGFFDTINDEINAVEDEPVEEEEVPNLRSKDC